MLSTILDAVTPKFNTLNKKSVLKSIDFLYGSLNTETIPAVKIFLESNVKEIDKSKFLSTVFKLMGLSGNNAKNVEKIQTFLIEIANSEKTVTRLANKLNDVLLDKVTNLQDASLVKIVNDFSFINLYILDMLYMGLIEDGSSTYPKKKIESTKEASAEFVMLYKYYVGKIDKILDELSKLPEINIGVSDTASGSMIDGFLNKLNIIKFLPATNGFINNPIYHFRMWLVDREIAKYEALKDRRKQLELRLLELRYQDSGGKDPKLRQQIEYYEDKLASVEYQIAKIEKD